MTDLNEGKYLMFQNYNEKLNKNFILTDSDDDYTKKNYDTEKITNKNINKIDIQSNISNILSNINYTNNKTKKNTPINNYNNINLNNNINFHNTIPRSKKNNHQEINSIDFILQINKDNDNFKIKKSFFMENKIPFRNNFNSNSLIFNDTIFDLEELENKKEILKQKLFKLKQKNKELINYLGPYQSEMTNEDLEHEQRLKYIKYLEDKKKKFIIINNKIKYELKNKNIPTKKKIQNAISNQIKEYEKIYLGLDIINIKTNSKDIGLNMNNDYSLFRNNTSKKETINDYEDYDEEEDYEFKNNDNNYTNNNLQMKYELSLGGGGGGGMNYTLNNTTDGINKARPKTAMVNNVFYNNSNNNTFKNNISNNKSLKLNYNNFNNNQEINDGNKNGHERISKNKYHKNNNIINNNNYKINQKKNSLPNSIKINKNSKVRKGSNTSSIISSNDNSKKSDFKNLKQITKITSGLNFGLK